MDFDFSINELVGLRIIHSFNDYGAGCIKKCYLTDEQQVYVEIVFDCGRLANPFSLLKCVSNGLISFEELTYELNYLERIVADKTEAYQQYLENVELEKNKRFNDIVSSYSIEELVEQAKNLRQKISSLQADFCSNHVPEPAKQLADDALFFYNAAFAKAKIEYTHAQFNELRRACSSGIAACFRNVNCPEKVIEIFENWGGINSYCFKPSFFVSLSAAYCDLMDVESAEHFYKIAEDRFIGDNPHLKNLRCRIDSIKWQLEH